MTRRVAGVLVALMVIAPAAALAQAVSLTLDASAAGLRYADSIRTSAATIGSSARATFSSATLDAAGSWSALGDQDWAAQGAVSGSAFSPALASLRVEGAASAGGSAHRGGTYTGQLEGLVRVHLLRPGWGIWAGGGGGRTWDGAAPRNVLVGDAGAWLERGGLTVVASLSPTNAGDSLRYDDAQLAAALTGGRLELAGSIGARAGGRRTVLGTDTRAWGSASATLWIADHVGLVAAAGSYPVDPLQGFPGGRYASLGVRVASLARARVRSLPRPAAAPARERAGTLRLESGGADTLRILRVYAPAAVHVDVAGDFSDWSPVAMTADGDGWWRATIAIDRGRHQVSIRQDGGPWGAPANFVTVQDEFGGAAGLLEVP